MCLSCSHRTVCERYLRAVLRNVSHRHCPALLELLEISARSFDPAQVTHAIMWTPSLTAVRLPIHTYHQC